MLSPGNWAAVTGVTLEPLGFDVFPGMWSPLKEKSLTPTDAGFLQARPFSLAAQILPLVNQELYTQYNHIM